MIFPITELLSDEASIAWIENHFHPKGLRCPNCGTKKEKVRIFRQRRRGTSDYRCLACDTVFNLYHGTIFSGSNLRPRQVVLLLRGVCKGESSPVLAEELSMARQSVHAWRTRLQATGYRMRAETPLGDRRTETDEMFQNAGGKGEKHRNKADPPRRRANKKRGHGTYENDRPPVVGTIGRRRGRCRLRVCKRPTKETLHRHVEQFTVERATCYSDEWQGDNSLNRRHRMVSHGEKEWARDDDGDGIREVHSNRIEGLWQTLRNFLRPFRGVHKKSLKYYVAMCEHL